MATDNEDRSSLARAGKSALAGLGTLAELAIPGAGLITRLVEHTVEVHQEAQRNKAEAFYLRLLHGVETPEEQEERVRKLRAVPEFAGLASACVADFEAEKAEVYALAALLIAEGAVPPETRRDLVYTLQQLRLEDMVFLFEVLVNEGTKAMHEIRKIESVRHPGILQRLLNTGCIEQKRGEATPRVSGFGKQVIDWIHSELPVQPPHEAQGRSGHEPESGDIFERDVARKPDPYDASGIIDPYEAMRPRERRDDHEELDR